MKNFKKFFAILIFVLPFALFNNVSWAEEAKTSVATASFSEVINHLNEAKPWLLNGDVANSTAHIKQARTIFNEIPGSNSPELKGIRTDMLNALIHSKKGHPKLSIESIDKAVIALQAL